MKLIATITLAITLNNAALFAHWKYANSVYESCYGVFDSEIEACMKEDLLFRITGTILFTEGSYLE